MSLAPAARAGAQGAAAVPAVLFGGALGGMLVGGETGAELGVRAGPVGVAAGALIGVGVAYFGDDLLNKGIEKVSDIFHW